MSVMLAEEIKRRRPHILIVFGGPEVSRILTPDGILARGENNELKSVDALVPGEGENALLNLVSHWKADGFQPCPGACVKVGDEFIWTKEVPVLDDLDSLPFPEYGEFETEDYGNRRQLVTYFNRGCNRRCVFCSTRGLWGRWRSRSSSRVIAEIVHQAAKYPEVQDFIFCDPQVNADMEELLSFCRLMRGLRSEGHLSRISWRGYASVRPEMTDQVCVTMRSAGCEELWIGVESGSQRVIDAMEKGFQIPVADALLKHCRLAGIRTMVSLMVGFPTETGKDFKETLDFVRRNASNISQMNASMAFIDDSTALGSSAAGYGLDVGASHPLYWKSIDGANTFPERCRRFEALSQCGRDEGIQLAIEPDGLKRMISVYERWRMACD
jgi:radical SAM superfamily enzyme YgiQ (UPF0313 family)